MIFFDIKTIASINTRLAGHESAESHFNLSIAPQMYCFNNPIPAAGLANNLNTNASRPVFILPDEHIKFLAAPKITNYFL